MSGGLPLAGKVAFITGGSRGIGKAIARRFAAAGARCAIAGRKLAGLEQAAAELEGLPGRVHPIACHVGRRSELEAAVAEAVREFGPIDVLVNNSATSIQYGPAVEATDEQFDKMVEVNLKGPFRLVNLVAPAMIERGAGGAIINVASISGLRPQPGSILYSMTKAALVMLTRQWARELGPHRIRVNALAPGLIQTELSAFFWQDDARRRELAGGQVLPGLGQPDQVAGAALFLASEDAGFVTGEVVVVDGGVLA